MSLWIDQYLKDSVRILPNASLPYFKTVLENRSLLSAGNMLVVSVIFVESQVDHAPYCEY